MTEATGPSSYINDILGQPRALRAAFRAISTEELLTLGCLIRAHERIVLTGMGASLFAMLPAWRILVAAGIPAWHLDTAELLSLRNGLLTDRTLVIAASQSGRSAELVTLAAQ